jgi:hypothetical protein
MQNQEAKQKPRALIQIWLKPEDIERAKSLPEYHHGLIVHFARTGYLKELEKAEKLAYSQETEKLAS